MKQPIQPVIKDEHGRERFLENRLVQHLLNKGGLDLNDLARVDATQEDRQQFAQLIGYSLDGFATLSYATDEIVYAAGEMVLEGKSEQAARIEYLEQLVSMLKSHLRQPIAALYEIHPDDLWEE